MRLVDSKMKMFATHHFGQEIGGLSWGVFTLIGNVWQSFFPSPSSSATEAPIRLKTAATSGNI